MSKTDLVAYALLWLIPATAIIVAVIRWPKKKTFYDLKDEDGNRF